MMDYIRNKNYEGLPKLKGPLKVDNPITSKVDRYKMRAITF